MDEFAFHASGIPQDSVFDFQERQFVFTVDNNNQSYPSGSIIFDLASLSNSGRWIDFTQSTLVVPLVLTLQANAANLPATDSRNFENAFAASLKNGYHQLINSMSVEITNNQVVNLTNFSNIPINYKLLTSMSVDDERNFGSTIGFSKDTAESIQYQGSAVGNGVGLGECNNVITQGLFNPMNGWGSYEQSNRGRIERMLKATSYDPTRSTPSLFTTPATCNAVAKNFVAQSPGYINYYITATIPLKILHDVFSKLPLTRGMYMRLIINTNTSCSTTVNYAFNNNAFTFTSIATSSQFNSVPYMVSPLTTATQYQSNGTPAVNGTGQGLALGITGAASNGAGSFQMSIGIGKSFNTTTSFSHVLTQCRIYACMYTMTPLYEELYMKTNPVKDIHYTDILSFQVLNIGAGNTFNQLLSNGISRLRWLLIHPMIAATANGTASAANANWVTPGTQIAGMSTPMASPFSSAPGTCGHGLHIGNFNVLVSGVNIYQSNYLYKFEHWLQEVRGSNCLNGGIPIGLSSGLISQSDFESAYPFVYVDLSRRASQANDDISRSIQIVGQNLASCAVDYYCFVGYERQITISTGTGSLVI